MDDEQLQQKIRRCLAAHDDVLEAYLFGSRARGTSGPLSDVDVAVYLEQPAGDADRGAGESGFGRDAELAADLMAALGENRVDIVVLNRAPPLLYHRVLRDGIRLLARDLRQTTTREGRALSRYCDFTVQQAKVDRVLGQRLAGGRFGR